MKLTRVHRVFKFKQSQWLKPYIEWNTKLRQEATNPFEVSLYKLMNNSFFGKTCEDVRKYTDVQILMEGANIEKLTRKEEYKRFKIYDEDLAVVLMEKKIVKLNKPGYIGSSIFELSKTFITHTCKQHWGTDRLV